MKKLALALALVTVVGFGSQATLANAKTKETVQSTAKATFGDDTDAWVSTRDGNGVNLRASRSTSSKVLAKLPDGTKVKLLSDVVSGWYKVRVVNSGTVGYISASYLVDKYGDGPGL
ncbi:bacterial SH3 domain protein [Clostridium puniceum]|uniref:Bacterial SH3 domain protein n=1 Tax=Clostridium puniceum TaxID=29367 RepID=A0A1S8TX60_9CLOT|nr:SH3 domain-containing protein [Clostridium puniceum]OOM82311.1 bacterial SH3 domain protein [Clostridium puniceum]